MYNNRIGKADWRIGQTEMGAPRKWINTLLGLKKSDILVSPGEENSSSGTDKIWQQRKHSIEIDNCIFANDLNQDEDIEFEDANFQPFWDPATSPSTSLEEQNAAELQWSMREEWTTIDAKDENFLSASDRDSSPSTPLQVQTVAQFNMREGRAAIDAKHANFQSVPSLTSSPTASLKVKNAAQPEHNMGKEYAALDAKDSNVQSAMDPTSPPYTSFLVQHAAQLKKSASEEWEARHVQTTYRGFLLQNGVHRQHNMSEESAAIRIQTVFRGFLARRALRGLKGLVRLQALVRGHAVRRQAAITLRCMQALVRVQARARARHARMALENQASQQKQQQELEPVEWCGRAGSADEIQAKLLKRMEAAANREKAKAYALARQWQARPKLQVAPVGFEPDKSNWGWNWLERWMAVRPWENNLSDINLQVGIRTLEKESGRSLNAPKTPSSISGKGKPGPYLSIKTNIPNEKRATFSHSDGFIRSPNTSTKASPKTPVSGRASSSPVPKNSSREATSMPSLGPRSLSNPRERSTLSDKQGYKRLSLPAQGTHSAAKLSLTTLKCVNARSK